MVELDHAVNAARMEELFRGLLQSLQGIYSRYSNAELELCLEFIREITRCRVETTAELSSRM